MVDHTLSVLRRADRLSDETLTYGRRIACALLGVDALYRAESEDGDGLVVVNLRGSESLTPDAYGSYADARAQWRALQAEAESLAEPDRWVYYDQLCKSTLAFIEWREAGLPFASQVPRFLQVEPGPVTEARLDALRGLMRALLERLGFEGPLARQCAAWEAKHRVDPSDVPATLESLLAEAWDRTEEKLAPIPATRDDAMKVATVSGVHFNARCDYTRRTIEINTDPVLTRPALKHLAVHEGLPGHYLQFKLRETMHAKGEAAADGLLSVVNSASSSVFEGIADAGMAAIDWVESDDDRLQDLLGRYRAGIGTIAAWRLHELRQEPDHVAAWLRSVSLVGGDGWVDNRMRFISAPARAVLIWSYWWGGQTIGALWDRVRPARRRDFVRWLYGRMHSLESAGMWRFT
jgi:hypothetical protein